MEAAGRRRSAQLRKPQRGQTLRLGAGSSDVASRCIEKLDRGRVVSTDPLATLESNFVRLSRIWSLVSLEDLRSYDADMLISSLQRT